MDDGGGFSVCLGDEKIEVMKFPRKAAYKTNKFTLHQKDIASKASFRAPGTKIANCSTRPWLLKSKANTWMI